MPNKWRHTLACTTSPLAGNLLALEQIKHHVRLKVRLNGKEARPASLRFSMAGLHGGGAQTKGIGGVREGQPWHAAGGHGHHRHREARESTSFFHIQHYKLYFPRQDNRYVLVWQKIVYKSHIRHERFKNKIQNMKTVIYGQGTKEWRYSYPTAQQLILPANLGSYNY
jgi:hypothetical protein